MTQSIEQLMTANLFEVFGERDADKRRAAIARVFTDDVVFIDPDGEVTGHEALDAHVEKLLASTEGFVFSLDGPVLVNRDLGHLNWNFGPAGEPRKVRGVDVGFVVDGLISKMYTLFY